MDAVTGLQSRTWPVEGAARVPFWVYSDQDVYAREQERIFGGPNWSYVALEAEIPNPYDFIRANIGDKPVVVTRDGNGSVNVFANHCAHRGVVFCRHARGNAKRFICPYHQWTYDSTGMLVAIPFRRGYKGKGGMDPEFKLQEHGAQALKVCRRTASPSRRTAASRSATRPATRRQRTASTTSYGRCWGTYAIKECRYFARISL
jgi:salicylate 5-hydroxylase large subunit